MKLSVCLEFFFKDLPIEQRIHQAKEAGFDWGELWHWRDRDLAALREQARKHGFRIASLCAMGPSPGFNDHTQLAAVLRMVKESLEAATYLGCPHLIVMGGSSLPDVDRGEQRRRIVEGLRSVADEAQERGILLVLEALNSRRDFPGYFLDSSDELFAIVRETDHPAVRALVDLYHLGIMEGDCIERIRASRPLIEHVHIAGVPGRHEPFLGELNGPVIYQALKDLEFEGHFGLEYIPTLEDRESLLRTREWLLGLGQSNEREN